MKIRHALFSALSLILLLTACTTAPSNTSPQVTGKESPNPDIPIVDVSTTVFTSLDELESNVLDSSENEFERLSLSNDAICYASYDSAVPYLQFTLVETDDAGNYTVKNQSEKITFTFSVDKGETTALYATYKLVPFSFIFSPTPIEDTEAYSHVAFSNAYFYYNEN